MKNKSWQKFNNCFKSKRVARQEKFKNKIENEIFLKSEKGLIFLQEIKKNILKSLYN